ncbi:MAG: hypothetical protein GY786_03660 [Proteobacteria bacterium]|nr:hypothetical protein [Pseudomonadota bacterium]
MKSRYLIPSLLLAIILFSPVVGFQKNIYGADNQEPQSDIEAEEDGFEEDGFGDSDGEDGFGDEGFDDGADSEIGEIKLDLSSLKSAESEEISPLVFGGFLKEELGYSYAYESSDRSPYDSPGISKLRTTANFYLDYKFLEEWKAKLILNGYYDAAYSLKGSDEFSDEVLESMESEIEVRDFFVEGPLADWLRLKFGRQVIAWGESDTAQITDMANPRDLREIGMVDLEDARIPVLATKFSALFGSLEVNLVAIHEFRANKMGAKGSEFDFLFPLRSNSLNDEETTGYDEMELLFRLSKSFNGGDLSLVWSDTYDDAFHLDASKGSAEMTPKHKKIQTIGIAGNKVTGSWLIKAEIGQTSGKAVALTPEQTITNLISNAFGADKEIWLEKTVLEGMIGADYSGISDVRITVEATGEQIQDYDDTLGDTEISGGFSLRVAHSVMNDTVNSTLFWVHYVDDNGDVIRADVQYDMMEALQLSGGIISYLASKSDATVYPIRNNDRLILSAKYSF